MDEKTRKLLKDQKKYYPVLFKVNDLVPYPHNPRKVDEEKLLALMNSMDKDPEFIKARPLLVNSHEGREGVVIAGNQRLTAAKELGWDKIPVVIVDVNERTEKDWNLKDNILAGEFIPEKVKEVLVELRDAGHDLTSVGFTPGETVDRLEGITTEEDINTSKNTDPNYSGSTPSGKQYRKCASCGHVAHKKDFEMLSKEEASGMTETP